MLYMFMSHLKILFVKIKRKIVIYTIKNCLIYIEIRYTYTLAIPHIQENQTLQYTSSRQCEYALIAGQIKLSSHIVQRILRLIV
jgi:hypothetical protein